jgi:hypothetical protein
MALGQKLKEFLEHQYMDENCLHYQIHHHHQHQLLLNMMLDELKWLYREQHLQRHPHRHHLIRHHRHHQQL